MAKKKHEEKELALCPVGRFFMQVERGATCEGPFFEHLNRSGVELMKALRSLLDEGIERMERPPRKRKKKATRIEVE